MFVSRYRRSMLRLLSLTSAALAAAAAVGDDAARKLLNRVVVEKIKDIKLEQNGQSLKVTAIGEVRTGGYTQPLLTPAVYAAPPTDGVQDLFLSAVKPEFAPEVISDVQAVHHWMTAPSWLKGVRIHGVGEGVKVKMLDTTAATAAPQRVTVPEITCVTTSIQKSNPPKLVVTATGDLPYPMHTDAQLTRAIYVQPPPDGIQDYFLTALPPPSPPINPVVQEVSASDTWDGFENEKWLKGVRVHGVDGGVVVKMLK